MAGSAQQGARKAAYTPARLPLLRWLTASGADVPPDIRDQLMSEIFASQSAVILGVINGLLLNAVALYLTGGSLFFGFIVIDVGLASCRIWVVRRGAAASQMGKPTPTDLYLVTAICWCALQGAMVFAAMRTGNPVLQLLGAYTAVGLIGPICARNYPAPRYGLLLVGLCDLPFVAGALMTENPLIAVMLLQTLMLVLGCLSVIRRLHRMAVALLEAEKISEQRAQRDPLTGLLNRDGLAKTLRGLEAVGTPFVLYCLDLDGFKAVNDRLGHPAGDALLQAVAARLQNCTRASDIVARPGGDEFVIVSPNLAPAARTAFADSVILRIADQAFALGAADSARIGVSVGSAHWPQDGPALALLQTRADAALYEAKKAGKGVHRRFARMDAGVDGAAA